MKKTVPSDFQLHGLTAHYNHGHENPHPFFHRHNEVELNFLGRGVVSYNHAGRDIALPPRNLTVFWGGISHRFSAWEPCGDIRALSIPLGVFLSWGLPRETFVHPLLHGGFLHEPDPGRGNHDEDAMARWFADIHPGDPATAHIRRAALLHELQARLLRLALDAGSVPEPRPDNAAGGIEKMLQFIAANCRDPALSVPRIARHAGLNPFYANDHFRKTCGVSLMRYVSRQRVTHAQCLLTTTGLKILDIAMESGFGSESQFYAVFRGIAGLSPREYARAHGK